ncbi:deoxyadenosine/deoxycytidine kinase [Balneicella halophila]|uniref:Deoxyadenosine/deoxycytidine kinase n=1 Tax=Balneicella halophila TaxID=1537566 RepID=A0A7L4UR22_BALHA|nr:deoxynucleoside kinase [Balneicella halophila]PVX51052.1 deoxyadenosine/deoxycytidine kinase [Balneicella halophila]
MHIAVAGNIGSGKTTLTRLLAKHYNWEPYYEDASSNPYLADFYDDMKRWSFNLQVCFLKSRFQQLVEIHQKDQAVIQDRTIYEDAMIFAPNLHDMGLMTSRDFANYQKLFKLMTSLIDEPDLLIYLKSSVPTLVGNIQKRGRAYEESIRLDYLKNLNNRYNSWIFSNYKGNVLLVDADSIDFLENKEDLNGIIDAVESKLHGLF